MLLPSGNMAPVCGVKRSHPRPAAQFVARVSAHAITHRATITVGKNCASPSLSTNCHISESRMRRAFDAVKELAVFEVIDQEWRTCPLLFIHHGRPLESDFRCPQDVVRVVDLDRHHRPIVESLCKEMSIPLQIARPEFLSLKRC